MDDVSVVSTERRIKMAREKIKCPGCDCKVSLAEVEKNDGACPECGLTLFGSTSTLFDDREEEEEEDDELGYDDDDELDMDEDDMFDDEDEDEFDEDDDYDKEDEEDEDDEE